MNLIVISIFEQLTEGESALLCGGVRPRALQERAELQPRVARRGCGRQHHRRNPLLGRDLRVARAGCLPRPTSSKSFDYRLRPV